jgi:hypothetical protein
MKNNVYACVSPFVCRNHHCSSSRHEEREMMIMAIDRNTERRRKCGKKIYNSVCGNWEVAYIEFGYVMNGFSFHGVVVLVTNPNNDL